MSIFLEDLKAKALAATPGEWTLRDRGVICGGPVTEYFRGKGQPQIVMCCGGEQIGHEQKTANEHFIAAAYPDAVLQLIDRLEKSEAERDALKAKTSSMMGVGNGPVPAQQVEITGEIPDFTEEETQRLIERLTSLKGEVVKVPIQNDLAVWYGPMPESNGKTNWTAILYRKNPDCRMGGIGDGYTIDRSEYPDRVRYEADRVRHLIGELKEPPFILDYDENKHSGYEEQQPSAVTHWSDCSTNNGPAMEPGECDCGGYPPKEPPCATE